MPEPTVKQKHIVVDTGESLNDFLKDFGTNLNKFLEVSPNGPVTKVYNIHTSSHDINNLDSTPCKVNGGDTDVDIFITGDNLRSVAKIRFIHNDTHKEIFLERSISRAHNQSNNEVLKVRAQFNKYLDAQGNIIQPENSSESRDTWPPPGKYELHLYDPSNRVITYSGLTESNNGKLFIEVISDDHTEENTIHLKIIQPEGGRIKLEELQENNKVKVVLKQKQGNFHILSTIKELDLHKDNHLIKRYCVSGHLPVREDAPKDKLVYNEREGSLEFNFDSKDLGEYKLFKCVVTEQKTYRDGRVGKEDKVKSIKGVELEVYREDEDKFKINSIKGPNEINKGELLKLELSGDNLEVLQNKKPILLRRENNDLFYISANGFKNNEIEFKIQKELNLKTKQETEIDEEKEYILYFYDKNAKPKWFKTDYSVVVKLGKKDIKLLKTPNKEIIKTELDKELNIKWQEYIKKHLNEFRLFKKESQQEDIIEIMLSSEFEKDMEDMIEFARFTKSSNLLKKLKQLKIIIEKYKKGELR